MKNTKLPFQIEADKQFIRDFGTPYKNHPIGDLTTTINQCCNTEAKIHSNVEAFSNFTRNAIHIECSVCARQSFKIWLPIESKSRTPSEVQIRYWNSEKS